jgi:hypothetical protein
MHRVIDVMPALIKHHPDLHYLIVGGASPEGDNRAELTAQVARLGLADRVHFLGALPSDELKWPLSASNVFVLATRNEGWANVFLEAMACGLPVVSTDVGGMPGVAAQLGAIVPFSGRCPAAVAEQRWTSVDSTAILDYAVPTNGTVVGAVAARIRLSFWSRARTASSGGRRTMMPSDRHRPKRATCRRVFAMFFDGKSNPCASAARARSPDVSSPGCSVQGQIS